jgi:4'-phosphopantetheinyl transferase
MIEVIILNVIPELTQNEFFALLPLISPEKQERIKRFHLIRDAQNCLLGDILTCIEVCCSTGFSNNQIEFTTNIYGKPFLENNSHVHFNVSHSGHYIAFAIDDEPVGVDIELFTAIDQNIIERFFTADEKSYIMKGNQIQSFYNIWTMKESRIKWEGKGINKLLNPFSILDPNERGSLIFYEVFQNAEAICHVCSTKKNSPIVKVIDTAMLLQDIMVFQNNFCIR